MRTISFFLSAVLLAACSTQNNSSDNKQVAAVRKTCTPFYLDVGGNYGRLKWVRICDGSYAHYRFEYSNISLTPNKLMIDSALFPNVSKELDLIFEKQAQEGISDAMSDILSDKIEPYLVKGDLASITEAQKVYVKALLDENSKETPSPTAGNCAQIKFTGGTDGKFWVFKLSAANKLEPVGSVAANSVHRVIENADPYYIIDGSMFNQTRVYAYKNWVQCM